MPDVTGEVVRPSEYRPSGRLSDEEFQALLVDALPAAYRYALRLTHEQADAEDLVQEAALHAFRGLGGFERGTNFKAWLFRIVTTSFWATHRKAMRRPQTVDMGDTPDAYLFARSSAAGLSVDGEDPAATLLDRLDSERVADAIAQLPEEFVEVCTLYFMEDLSYQEIAEVIGVPIGTVRSRLHRGRKLLQPALWQLAQDAGIVGDRTAPEGDR